MSFAQDVKMELTKIVKEDVDVNKAELSAILKISSEIIISNNQIIIEFKSTNPSIAKRVLTLTKSLYAPKIELITKKWMRLNKKNIYIIKIMSKGKEILSDLYILNMFSINKNIPLNLIKTMEQKQAFLRGCFLAKGSVNSPNKATQHLEIATDSNLLAEDLINLLTHFNVVAKSIKRKNNFIVYIKKVEKISDFLRVIESSQLAFIFEGIRIERDFSNQITRLNNIDLANNVKTLKTCNEQLDYIRIISKHMSSKITKRLKEAIKLRLKYRESSLQELSDLSIKILGYNVSKSGLNHRFRDIKKIALEIIEEREK